MTFFDPPPLRLCTFGRAVLLNGAGMVLQPAGKPLALLTYLRAGPGGSATRDQLVDLLWADSAPERGRQALRQTLLRLGQALGKGTIQAERDTLTLAAPLWHDRSAFLEAIEAGDMERAVELYGGPFFPAFASPGALGFEHWAEAERRHLAGMYQRAAAMEVRRFLETDARKALRIARRMRDDDPELESGWRLVLRSALAIPDLVQAGSEAMALHRMLADAGRPPEPATAALLQEANREYPGIPGLPEPHRLTPELIGRERHFVRLLEEWKDATAGSPRLLHVEAHAGLGKSRLLGDFAVRLRALGHQVVELRAHPGEQQLAGSLAADLVRSLAALPGALGVSPESAVPLAGLEPSLLHRFREAQKSRPVDPNPYRAGVALADLLAAVADERPTAVLLDDLHWADPTSRLVLAAAANRLGHSRLLLVTTARPVEAGAPLVSGTATLALEAWTPEECRALVAALAGADPAILERLGHAVCQTSGGSPLLALETLQRALESERLEIREGQWWSADWTATLSGIAEADPIGARIRSMGSMPRQLLLRLALAGSQVPVSLLGDESESMQTRDGLMDLEVRGLAVRRGETWTIGHDEIAGAVRRLTPETEQRAAAGHLGRRCLAQAGDDPARLHCAIRLLRSSGDPAADAAVLRAFRLARQAGDRRKAALIVASLLGETPNSDESRRVVRRLPVWARFGVRSIHAATAAAIALLLLGWLAWWPSGPPAPDAELLVITSIEAGTAHLGRARLWRDRWVPGAPIAVEPSVFEAKLGIRWCSDMQASPDGRRLALTWCVADSGLTDIAIQELGGSARRLTFTPGDDVHPSWSPDGKSLVFATARWSARGDFTDLAVLDLATGAVRQLTAGADTDQVPFWSPDGTRIAFVRVREADGLKVLCIVTASGSGIVCDDLSRGPTERVVGWNGSNQVILLRGSALGPGHYLVLRRLEEPDDSETTLVRNIAYASVSQDGRWVAVSRNESPGELLVFPVDQPAHIRRVRGVQSRSHAAWIVRQGQGYLDQLSVQPPLSGLIPGVDHQLRYRAIATDQSAIRLAPGVVTWRVSDSTLAAVTGDGLLRPKRPGRVTVTADAGGWRRDSAVLVIQPARSERLDSITWSAEEWDGWERFGTPEPRRDKLPDGRSVMLINGDETYESGVVSRRKFPVRGGLGMEALVTIPVREPRWQQLKAGLEKDVKVGPDQAAGVMGCSLNFPSAEGKVYLDSMSLGAGPFKAQMEPALGLGDGQWHRLTFQVGPDGSCEFAVDGSRLTRSRPVFAVDDSVQLMFYGHSVDTRIAVGPVVVWRGYRGQ